jgi:hypothetical protein
VKCLEEGKLEVEGETLDTATDLESKLAFSREGDQWEATPNSDGSLVIAVDCAQDEAIISAGQSRELMNSVQQLRKSAGLDIKDFVEVFFLEEKGVSVVEEAVARNVALFEAKFRGGVPLPQRFAPSWSVVLRSDVAVVGGTSVQVSICRPAVAAKDSLEGPALAVLSTLEPASLGESKDFTFTVDGNTLTLKEGTDFWPSTVAKMRATKVVPWM